MPEVSSGTFLFKHTISISIFHFQEQDVVTLQELLYMFLQPNTQADL